MQTVADLWAAAHVPSLELIRSHTDQHSLLSGALGTLFNSPVCVVLAVVGGTLYLSRSHRSAPQNSLPKRGIAR